VDPSGLATWYLRRQVIVDKADQWRFIISAGTRLACSPFGPLAAWACFTVGFGVFESAAHAMAGRNFLEVRQAYYATDGRARMVFRAATVSSTGKYAFAAATTTVYYRCGTMAAAKACTEVLTGLRNPYQLDWWCGNPYKIV
jgi:hypothetical protein